MDLPYLGLHHKPRFASSSRTAGTVFLTALMLGCCSICDAQAKPDCSGLPNAAEAESGRPGSRPPGSIENMTKESEAGPVRDAGLIATAQKIEHYEIAFYGSARNWAKQLRIAEHAETLQKTLDEEKHADHLLTQISHRTNSDASSAAA